MADGAPEQSAREDSAPEPRAPVGPSPVGPSPAGASFDGLSTTLVTDDANLRDALRRVAILGCKLVPLCASSSVTIIERGRAITAGSSSAVAEMLDAAQYDEDDGPCLRAARVSEVVRIHDADADDRWPAFSRTAAQHGVFSSLSVPLLLPAAETRGGFNVYGSTANAFSGTDEETCRAFAAQASVVVSNAQAYWAAFELTRHLTTAMESRATIEQAKGVLIAQHDELGLDAARQLLGLTFVDLWVEYFALGGCLDAEGLTAYLQHEDAVGSSDHDVIVHALNEMFTERGENHPVAYHHV